MAFSLWTPAVPDEVCHLLGPVREVRLGSEADLECGEDGGLARTVPPVDEVHLSVDDKTACHDGGKLGRERGEVVEEQEHVW